MNKSKMETTMNAYHIKVNKICASCKHKECTSDGTRVCQKMGLKVEQKYKCRQWEMADGLKNAGLQNGGVVLRKRSSIAERAFQGTQEIIIK